MTRAFAFLGILIGILGFLGGGIGFTFGPPEYRTWRLFVGILGCCMAAACMAVLWD
jgi:hypothetical protein